MPSRARTAPSGWDRASSRSATAVSQCPSLPGDMIDDGGASSSRGHRSRATWWLKNVLHSTVKLELTSPVTEVRTEITGHPEP
jgi:hypothetical protein